MKNKITKNHIFLYSTLSFHKYQNTDLRIKKWSLNHIKEILRKKDVEFKNNYIISRHQRLILLKYLLINITTQNKSKHYNKELKLLYKLFLKINDIEVDLGNFTHFLVNAGLFSYRDNFLSQFKRTKDIFLFDNSMLKYQDDFFQFLCICSSLFSLLLYLFS